MCSILGLSFECNLNVLETWFCEESLGKTLATLGSPNSQLWLLSLSL